MRRVGAPAPYPELGEGGAAFVACARCYLGVKWRHLGRDPARGLDCVGLVLVAAQDAGLLREVRYPSYGRRPDGHRLTAEVARHCRPVPMAEMAPGDVLTFAGVERLPCHLAIVSETAPAVLIVHAWAEHGRVAEHALRGFSGGRSTGCWRIVAREAQGHPLTLPSPPQGGEGCEGLATAKPEPYPKLGEGVMS